MDKIYSRFRLPRIVSTQKMDNHKKFLIIVMLVILIAYFSAVKIIDGITPFIERQSRVLARSAAAKISNEATKEKMEGKSYQDLCSVEKDEQGNVKLIKLDVITINQICSNIALQVQEELSKQGNTNFDISLGTITGNKFFVGKGPKVRLVLVTEGNVETNIKSEFSDAGINQTLHKIYINIICHITMLSPYKDIDEDVQTQVLLAEAVIVGNIPDTYYNLNGLNEGDTLNFLE